MLVVSRKVGEKIIIGDCITVSVVQISGNRVRLSIDAPQNVRVDRAEIAARRPHEISFELPQICAETVCAETLSTTNP